MPLTIGFAIGHFSDKLDSSSHEPSRAELTEETKLSLAFPSEGDAE